MKKKTFYHLIVDKSGSMGDCIPATIGGYNEQMQAISSLQERFPEQEISVGLTIFNEDVHHQFYGVKPSEVKPLTTENYQPNGTTALLDAIGMSVSLIKEKNQSNLLNLDNTVVVVIITDGYENASHLFNLKRIREMITTLEATGQWTFSYLGATLDAVDVADRLAIKKMNSMSFSKDRMNSAVWDNLNESMEDYLQLKKSNERTASFLKKNK
jgi:hypothetical protein